MRILNDPEIKTHLIGIYPEGTIACLVFIELALMINSPPPVWFLSDVPVQEIYKYVVVPDMFQLEQGVTINGTRYVGTIHFIAGDHVELCKLAGIPTGAAIHVSYTCVLHEKISSHLLPGPNATFLSRHTMVKGQDYFRFLLDPEFRKQVSQFIVIHEVFNLFL